MTTEVPALHIALARAPVELALDLRRLNGDVLAVRLLFPDESQRANPQGLRNQRPDEAYGHHRRLSLPRDLLRCRNQSRIAAAAATAAVSEIHKQLPGHIRLPGKKNVVRGEAKEGTPGSAGVICPVAAADVKWQFRPRYLPRSVASALRGSRLTERVCGRARS